MSSDYVYCNCKKYKKYHNDIRWGGNLGDVVINLISAGFKDKTLYYTTFNGKKLYSDTVSLNNAYKKVTGVDFITLTHEQEEKLRRKQKEKKKFESVKPIIIKHYISEGEKILDKKYLKEWKKLVPIRVGDIYEGYELRSALRVINILNTVKNPKCDKIKREDAFIEACHSLDDDKHSGLSYQVTLQIIRNFCDIGDEFLKYVEA